jgi:uridylate kinase
MSEKLQYRRVLLKLSGEVLGNTTGSGINFDVTQTICEQILACVRLGVQVGIVVGGGNFWRGRSSGKMDAVLADHMGMLATVMNVLALSDTFNQLGAKTLVQSAILMPQICECFNKEKAIDALEAGKVVLFGGGTGNPFFTTDSGAALRAIEIEADLLLKATNVDGVYDKDPHKYSDAIKFDSMTPGMILKAGLGVMDPTCASLCRDKNLPMLVFNLQQPQNILRAVAGEHIGTLIKN